MDFENVELKPSRIGFGEGLKEIGKRNSKVMALGADITSSVNMDIFKNEFPERFFSMGIAEQNIAGVAAGMALDGKIPFFATYGVFAAMRTADQVRVSICYNNLPVKIGGAHAGISVGPDGATHQALEDVAVMRSLPNMTILSPCDANQVYLATIAAVEQIPGPVYIRFGREPMPNFTDINAEFTPGKGQLLRNGNDMTIVATGHLVFEALKAADELKKNGIDARVINIHTIKPIDKDILIKAAKETGKIIVAEEHQIHGGLFSAVSEVLVQNYPVPVGFVGMNDEFGESGTAPELMQKYEMLSEDIVKRSLGLCGM